MPLHKRFARTNKETCRVNVPFRGKTVELLLVNTETEPRKAYNFSEVIKSGLATGNLKDIRFTGTEFICAIRTGFEKEQQIKFTLVGADTNPDIQNYGLSLLGDIQERLTEMQRYDVFRDDER